MLNPCSKHRVGIHIAPLRHPPYPLRRKPCRRRSRQFQLQQRRGRLRGMALSSGRRCGDVAKPGSTQPGVSTNFTSQLGTDLSRALASLELWLYECASICPKKWGAKELGKGFPIMWENMILKRLRKFWPEEMCRFTSELFLLQLEGGSFQLRWAVWTYWDLGSQNQ